MDAISPHIEERARLANRITWLSVILNVFLTIGKLCAGILGHSSAMIADALHSLSDFATDFAVMFGMHLATRPEDHDHPYGHGKYETLVTIIIGCVLAGVGAMIGYKALLTLWDAGVHHLYPVIPGKVAFIAGIVSILVKEGLYHVTMKVARKTKCDAVKANAWHHRSDALSSIGTTLGIGCAYFLGGKWVLCDAVAAVIVGGILIFVAWQLTAEALDKLLECSMTEAEKARIYELIFLTAPLAAEPHHLRTRRVGTLAVIEFHLRMDGLLTVTESHRRASHIETLLKNEFGNDAIVTIHIEPYK